MRRNTILAVLILVATTMAARAAGYDVVDTGQDACYDASLEIACPALGEPFCGQDAQYDGNQPSLILSSDGLTVYDQVTGLTWVASPDTDGDQILESPGDKLSWWDAMDFTATLNAEVFGGFDDWRVPSIKELYSLIDFRGIDPSGYQGNPSGLVPFIDTNYFEFEYGNEQAGERIIDSQYWTSTEYVSTTMNGDHTVFGVNFADGRIKGYGTSLHGNDKVSFVLCCRGNPDYGINSFTDNGDGTVTDSASGQMWQQDDSGYGMIWEDALAYAEDLVFAGHNDWRLPNTKELQGIVDYTRSPDTHGTAAIDPVFGCTAITDEGGTPNFPFYWSGTTHANWSQLPGAWGAYVCFGEALGWMRSPFPPYDYTLMDVHGAGAQRSDPKEGDPTDWPYGNGPQGDVVRVYNYVRCVRDAETESGLDDLPNDQHGIRLGAAPSPFRQETTILFSLPETGNVDLSIYDLKGRRVRTLLSGTMDAGEHALPWEAQSRDARLLPSGVYFVQLTTTTDVRVARVILAE